MCLKFIKSGPTQSNDNNGKPSTDRPLKSMIGLFVATLSIGFIGSWAAIVIGLMR